MDSDFAVVLDFIERYLSDRANGTVAPVEAYVTRYPGFEHAVRREYERLSRPVEDTPAEAATEDPADHAEQIGPYRTIREIGRGGQGVVYLADDTRLSRNVALKVLTSHGLGTKDLLRRFRREAEVAASLQHPGICPVLEANMVSGVPYIAMPFIPGESLAQKIVTARNEALPEGSTSFTIFDQPPRRASHAEERDPTRTPSGPDTRTGIMDAVSFIEQVARALHAAHEAGVIHRDIKPGNIRVTPDARPVILDFGLARSDDQQLQTLTRTGEFFGTPAYMSPEQLMAHRVKVDRRTDVWSLGVTLFECLTLRRPFEAPTREGLYAAILTKDHTDVRQLNAAVPYDLRVVVDTALEKDLDRRYRTALALAEDLRCVREYEPIRARPVGLWGRGRRWVHRNPALAASLLGIALVVAVGVAVSGYLLGLAKTEGKRAEDAELHLADARTKAAEILGAAKAAARERGLVTAIDQHLRNDQGEGGAWVRNAERLLEEALTMVQGSEGLPSGDDPDRRSTREEIRRQLVPALENRLWYRTRALSKSPGRSGLRATWDDYLAWMESDESAELYPRRSSHANLRSHDAPSTWGAGLAPLGRDQSSGLWEFHLRASGQAPAWEGTMHAGQARLRPNSGLVFVLIPGGSFVMGAQKDDRAKANYDPSATSDEYVDVDVDLPLITLDPFLLSKFECTVGQFCRIWTQDAGAQPVHPMVGVSWEQVARTCQEAGLVLPTEAQWEYACRAGTTGPWSCPLETLHRFANLGRYKPLAVGCFLPNPFGLHDMHANVYEWCQDSKLPFAIAPRSGDGLRVGPTDSATRRTRVYRGGGFDWSAHLARSAARAGHRPDFKYPNLGFRPARPCL